MQFISLTDAIHKLNRYNSVSVKPSYTVNIEKEIIKNNESIKGGGGGGG